MTILSGTSVQDYLDQLSQRSSTPGGGTAAAVSAAQGAALISMVAEFTKGHDDQTAGIIDRAKKAVARFLVLADEDATAFDAVMAAYKGKDKVKLDKALIDAATVPANLIDLSMSLLDDLETLTTIGNPNLISDVAIAAELLQASIRSAELNILINTGQLANPDDHDTSMFDDRLHTIPECCSELDKIAAEIKDRLIKT